MQMLLVVDEHCTVIGDSDNEAHVRAHNATYDVRLAVLWCLHSRQSTLRNAFRGVALSAGVSTG